MTKLEGDMLSDDLKRFIAESGLTAYALGKRAGITPDVVLRFCAGERELRTDTAGKLCAALGLELKRVEESKPETKNRKSKK